MSRSYRFSKRVSGKKCHVHTGHQSGSYLLEFAVVIFGIAVFVVGFADIATIFHARGAVRAAVTDSLRCLYPTDAGCGATPVIAGPGSQTRYNAWISGAPGFEIQREQVSLYAGWFTEPVYRAELMASKLVSVGVDKSLEAYRRHDVLFPVDAHAPYLLKVRDLPRLVMASDSELRGIYSNFDRLSSSEKNRLRVMNPTFVQRPSGAVLRGDAAGDQVLSISTIRLRTSSTTLTGYSTSNSVSFSVDDAWGASDRGEIRALKASRGVNVPCYQGNLVNGKMIWPSNSPPASCSYHSRSDPLLQGERLLVPIMLRISGGRDDTPRGSSGAVEAQLVITDQAGIVTTHSLGGRRFDSDSREADFVTRGAGLESDTWSSYGDTCKSLGYTECADYQDLALVPVGARVQVRFAIRKVSGKQVGWNGDRLQIFYPKFEFRKDKSSCGYSSDPKACAQSVAPIIPSYYEPDRSLPIGSKEAPGSVVECHRNKPDNYHASLALARAALQDLFVSAELTQAVSFWANSSEPSDQCTPLRQTVGCRDEFKSYLTGCDINYPEEQIREQCDLADFKPERDRILPPRIEKTGVDQVDIRGGCTSSKFPECAVPHLKREVDRFLGSASNGCLVAQPVVAPSESYGPFFSSTCADNTEDLVSRYREKNKIPREVEVGSATSLAPPLYSTDRPGDRCHIYRELSGDERQIRRACAENTTYSLARRCCEVVGPEFCEVSRVLTPERPLLKEGGSSDGLGDSSSWGVASELVRARVLESVQVAYPAAQGLCPTSDSNCLSVSVTAEDDATRARVAAALNVPLRVLGWLGGASEVVVSYQEARTLERALVGNSVSRRQ